MLAREWVKWAEKRENPISTQIFPLRLEKRIAHLVELVNLNRRRWSIWSRFHRRVRHNGHRDLELESTFFLSLIRMKIQSTREEWKVLSSVESGLAPDWTIWCWLLMKKRNLIHILLRLVVYMARVASLLFQSFSFISFFLRFPSTSELWATIAMDVDDGKLYNNETRLAKRFSWCSAVKHESSLKKSGWGKSDRNFNLKLSRKLRQVLK